MVFERGVAAGFAALALVGGACSAPRERAASAAEPGAATPEPSHEAQGRRENPSIPVDEAVARLARHVDTRIVLPHDHLSGVVPHRGWVADRRHLDWDVHGGQRAGTLVIRKRREVLWISYGHASPDGCGGRDTAVRTDVLGEPALLWTFGGRWGQLVWPVSPHGRTGRYGLAGSFEGWQLVRLAESMEAATRRPIGRDDGC